MITSNTHIIGRKIDLIIVVYNRKEENTFGEDDKGHDEQN